MTVPKWVVFVALVAVVVAVGVAWGPEIGAMVLLIGGIGGAAASQRKRRSRSRSPDVDLVARMALARQTADAKTKAAADAANAKTKEAAAHVQTTASGHGRERNARRLSRLFRLGGKSPSHPP